MNTKILLTALLGLVIASLLAFLTGCDEVESAALGPTITPSSVTISKGQSIAFQASDGFTYTWSLDDNTLGMLSNNEGPRTTYTSLADPASGEVQVQVLTLSSTIEGATGDGGTNGTGFLRTAEAFIRHIGLAISPTSVEIEPGRSVNFRVTGGSSYTWSLQFESWGSLSARSGNSSTYTAFYNPPTNSTATQKVIVRSFESEVSASVTHLSE